MESLFRKLLNAGLGIASKTTRFADDVINDLIAKGKLSEDEGKKIINDFEREGEEQRKVFEKEMNEYIEKAMQKMDIPSRDEYNRLNDRISVLENSQPGNMQVHDLPQ